jgi:hypothetical protein
MTCNCTFTTIAEKVNVKIEAKIEALITEKLSCITQKVDALGGDITNVVRVVDGLAAFVDAKAPTLDALLRQAGSSVDVEPVPVVPPVPPVDMAVTHTLMMGQCAEMRQYIASEQEKTRVFIRKWALAVVFACVMAVAVVSFVFVAVYMHKEPVVCEPVVCEPLVCEPVVCEPPAEALPSVYDNMMCCARMFTKDEY